MPSTSKTTRLKLNVWAAEDSPLRTDFNSDNELIDAAVTSLENSLAANGSDHAALRAELSALVSGASDALYAYARETRRLALDAYAMASAAEIAGLEPGASEAWSETFTDLADLDFSAATTCRYLVSDDEDPSINYLAATAGLCPSYGDTDMRSTNTNVALPFTLAEESSITRIITRPAWHSDFDGDLNVTCAVYRATASGSTYKLGEQVFSATKPRSTKLPAGQPYVDDPVNYVDAPFTLAAGTYCVVFHGTLIRANQYDEEHEENNPRLAPYDKLYTLPADGTSTTLAVTANYYADASISWQPTAKPYGWLYTNALGFDRPIAAAALYVYADAGDLQCSCSVIDPNGASADLAPDPDMINAPCTDGLYVTKLAASLADAPTGVKLKIGLASPSLGTVKRILFIAMRTAL